jgi:hypothetical protein
MDLLPGLFAVRFFPAGHHIVGTRIAAALLTLAAFACFLFAAYQIFAFVRPGGALLDLSLCFLGLLLLLLLNEYLGRGSPRRLIFFLQVGLVFRLLRRPREWVAAFLIGATLPVGFIFNYAIGVAGILFVTASGLLIWLRESGVGRLRSLAAIVIGALLTAAVCCALLGTEWLSTIAANMSYWSRFGQVLTFTPMFRREWLSRPEWFVYALLLIVPPALAIAMVTREFLQTRNLTSTLRRRTAEILLLVLCIADSRTFLERADFQHFGFAAPVFVLAAATLAMILLGPVATLYLRSWNTRKRIYVPALLLALIALIEAPNLRPGAIVHKAEDLRSAIAMPDSSLLRTDYAAAVTAMKPLVSRQTCFYTLTSEGAWYDLLDSPSCSSFAQLNYARSSEGQARVLAELRRFRPPVILVDGEFRDGGYDDIPLAQHSRPVWDYVMSAYRPLRTVGGFRFYELRP